jgi:hypothetical protein
MNRQVYPSSLFPLRGDITAEAGATSVVVQGLQTIPISPTPPSTTVPQTLVAIGGTEYIPTDLDTSIQINGVPASDDYEIGVNLPLGPASTPISLNGSLI